MRRLGWSIIFGFSLAGPLGALATATPAPALALSQADRAWLAAHRVIRIQMAQASAPFEFRDEQGRPQGLSYDILSLVCRRLGLAIQVTPLDWSDALGAVQRPHPPVDLLLGVTDSDLRRRQMALTDVYTSFPYVIFTSKSHPFIGGLGDLVHSTVAVEKDDVMESWLRRDLPQARILVLPQNYQVLQAVSDGLADAYVGNLAIGSYTIQQLGLVNLKVAAPAPYGQDAYCFGVRRDWPRLVALLNRGIAGLGPGQVAALHRRWLEVRYDHGLRWRDVLGWLGLSLGLAAVFILQLRRMVRDRTAALTAEIDRRGAAEGELRGSLAREQDIRRRLADILDFLPDATLVLDAQRRVLAWNRAMERLTGLPQAAVLGQGPPVYVEPFYGEPRPLLADWVLDGEDAVPPADGAVLRQGRLLQAQRFLPRLRQGRGAHVYATASPLLDSQGATVGAIECIRDITEQKALESQLAQAQRLEAIGTLAAGIAHDFNNILAAVGGYAELALARDLEPELKRDLRGIAKGVGRAADLVGQILAFSRVQPEAPRPLRPRPLVAEALKLLRASIPAGVRIEAELGSDAAVLADPAEIHRLVVNLCSNAAVALGGQGRLTVGLKDLEPDPALRRSLPGMAPGRQVCLWVEDDGRGMTAEIQARVFDPFFTTRAGDGGTGLGLAVVHGIVHSRGGVIQVESAPGQGARFSLYLPAVDAPETGSPAAPPPPDPGPGRGRLMLVDDEPELVEVLGRSLRRRGWEVEGFGDGPSALARLAQAPADFDLLVTDKTMPGVDGVQVAEAAKALRPGLPVILCTGYDERAPAAAAVDRVLRKPVSMDDLDAEVRRLLLGKA